MLMHFHKPFYCIEFSRQYSSIEITYNVFAFVAASAKLENIKQTMVKVCWNEKKRQR